MSTSLLRKELETREVGEIGSAKQVINKAAGSNQRKKPSLITVAAILLLRESEQVQWSGHLNQNKHSKRYKWRMS